MAQQGGRRKKAPAYSADTMALRYIAGLALAALGVMIFMAVDLNMSGNIFQGLRQVCFGVTGSLAAGTGPDHCPAAAKLSPGGSAAGE